ncbi:hypothetical protein Cgig2_025901 [Carnegiea gigantea]|uniref:Uncharacterized protein n=1 Tax=Carnegiea gigantea TaxID=171969 RepID=A0A9Q1QCV2_9CARY|nr:hypothetical protein Cgig2_025901 [Carnegiea gigantea]
MKVGFRKVATSRWEFSNDKFQRGKRDLLSHIRRRKAWSNRPQPPLPPPHQNQSNNQDEDQRSTSTSSSSSSDNQQQRQLTMINILVDENKRLKRENGVLSSELTSMKRKCQDLLELVSAYVGREQGEREEKRLKLFGVRLEVKEGGGERKKREKEEEEVYETARLLLSQSCK